MTEDAPRRPHVPTRGQNAIAARLDDLLDLVTRLLQRAQRVGIEAMAGLAAQELETAGASARVLRVSGCDQPVMLGRRAAIHKRPCSSMTTTTSKVVCRVTLAMGRTSPSLTVNAAVRTARGTT